MKHVLAVDAGNSKTVAAIVREDGIVVGHGGAGCGDILHAPSTDEALSNVKSAVAAAMHRASRASAAYAAMHLQLSAAMFSMAGADWPDDYALLQERLGAAFPDVPLRVCNDAVGALYAGAPEGFGVAVACGTYAATSGVSADHLRVWHSSAWITPFGGATALGQEAIHAVIRAEVPGGEPTMLTKLVLEAFAVASVEELLYLRTSRAATASGTTQSTFRPDRLSRLVLDAALAGDHAASAIVSAEGAKLATYALMAAREVGLQDCFPLVLAGGVFKHECRQLADSIVSGVRRVAPHVVPEANPLEPVCGAAVIALEAARVPVDAAVRENLKLTCPRFET